MIKRQWHSYKDYNPSNVEVDIKLIDGSILRNTLWQSDRDFYWKSKPNPEIFICEFSVTHWRLCKNELLENG